jgi:hypothetical protein
LPPNADECKARDEAKGGSLGEERRRRRIWRQPEGTGVQRNGISAVLDFHRNIFVNSALTINLLRKAEGEWICIDARTLLGPNGGGLAEARIFDALGLIGRSTQSLVIRLRE